MGISHEHQDYPASLTPGREWYGSDRVDDPKPASLTILQQFIPALDTSYESIWTPCPTGETIEELYTRCAYVLAKMIKDIDDDPNGPTAILICTHAASFIAICRVLAGARPSTPIEADFIPWTSCITQFQRKKQTPVEPPPEPGVPGQASPPTWPDDGVGGGWNCTMNGYCGFLSHGEERGWQVHLKLLIGSHGG